MEIYSKSPANCTEAELMAFEKLVTEGGEVSLAGLRERINGAEKLIFIYDTTCAGVGALKNPNQGYKSRIFDKAQFDNSDSYQYELGWLFVSESARGKGYGRFLMTQAVENLGGRKCFATTREDNDAMHRLFHCFGFSRQGKPYKSSNGDYSLALYTTS